MLLLLWCSGCTWRGERAGNALDSGRVNIVAVDKKRKLGVIVVLQLPCCCLHVTIDIGIVIDGLHYGCSC